MKVVCTTSFKDGHERFERGERLATMRGLERRVVTEEQIARFQANGWVREDGVAAAAVDPQPKHTEVQLHDSIVGHEEK